MPRLTILALFALSSCADFERGFMDSYNRAHSGPVCYADAPIIAAPSYVAPTIQPMQNGMMLTPGQPATFYSFNPNTGTGMVMRPGQPTTFIYGH